MLSWFKNYFQSASFVKYIITIVISPIAAKYGLDAVQTGSLENWLIAGVMGVITFGPAIWTQITQPSKAAMKVAVQADRIMDGHVKDSTTVVTPSGVPNIIVTPALTRGGQG